MNIDLLHDEIEAFCQRQEAEEYHISIPAQHERRGYLGLSALGDECLRKVWYDWRQVADKKFPGRLLRLFRRGHREEAAVIHLLRGIGFTVWETDEDGKQFGVKDFEGHLSGHCDGVARCPAQFGCDKPFLLEFKTYNEKRFTKLCLVGVEANDPKYYVQMQGYMGYMELPAALFIAVNKNTDEIYFEFVEFNERDFQNRVVQRAEDVLTATTPPPRLSNMPTDYRCKYCDMFDICHKGAPALKTCRTCRHGEPAAGGSWVCALGNKFGTVCNKYQDITK